MYHIGRCFRHSGFGGPNRRVMSSVKPFFGRSGKYVVGRKETSYNCKNQFLNKGFGEARGEVMT